MDESQQRPFKFSQTYLWYVSFLSMFPWKKTMRNTTAWMNRGNLWRYPRPISCADCTKSKCHHRLSRVNQLSYFEVSTHRHLSLSLSLRDSHLDAHFQVSNHRLSLSHTHRHLDAYFQVSKHRLSLSLPQNCHLDAYFQVSNHPLSLSLSHIIVTPTLISSCQTIVSLSQRSSPRCLFPGAEPSSISLSLSLTEIMTSISFLHTQTNKAQATGTHSASQ